MIVVSGTHVSLPVSAKEERRLFCARRSRCARSERWVEARTRLSGNEMLLECAKTFPG
jgi:hypothetical protein